LTDDALATEPFDDSFVQPSEDEPSLDEWLATKLRMQKTKEKMSPQPKKQFTVPKQKRTLRRTFHIGRSPHMRKVGVLISNLTIRSSIENKCKEIKQTPIDEVRKFLIKKGFIKVGSIAPNDVLRKMYESVRLVAGDVTNYNGDNLVYNYFNDGF
jgi:hypothetical protein